MTGESKSINLGSGLRIIQSENGTFLHVTTSDGEYAAFSLNQIQQAKTRSVFSAWAGETLKSRPARTIEEWMESVDHRLGSLEGHLEKGVHLR